MPAGEPTGPNGWLGAGGTLLNVTGNAQNKANHPQADVHTPLHPSRVGQLTDKMKAQIEEGIRITTERIQRAIGETGTPNS